MNPGQTLRGDNEKFWRDEWEKHGSCIGLDQDIYFIIGCTMKENATLVENFASQGLHF